MKKELLLASLMLTSPAALANQTDTGPQDLSQQNPSLSSATWVFEADDYIRIPRFDYDSTTQTSTFSHNEVIKTSIHFFPVDSSSDLFDFSLKNFDPIKSGEQEFEVAFRTHNITDDITFFQSNIAYYAIKKGDEVFLFDCDSTKRCDGAVESQTFAILKMKKNGTLKFTYKSRIFDTPYLVYNYETGEEKDLGAKITYKLQN